MDFEIFLFTLLVIFITILIILINLETLLWRFSPIEKLNKYILGLQREGKICEGEIRYPSKDDYQTFNVINKEYSLLFYKTFYRIIISKENLEYEKILLKVTVSIFFPNYKVFKLK